MMLNMVILFKISSGVGLVATMSMLLSILDDIQLHKQENQFQTGQELFYVERG
jgi:hypothetical protein